MVRHATVLVAEDEPDIRLLVRVNLTYAGLRVLEAKTGEEAVEIASREDPDVLLLDLRLPVWEGWEVLR
ncbi:MAG TPA: response regulator, partial [Actinomycetota bacterium]|nr:response regulator [Actinomycetota bacterium]